MSRRRCPIAAHRDEILYALEDKDAVVVGSGAVEIMLGAGLVALPRERTRLGAAVAAFFIAVFPGNVHQWQTGRSAPLLDTDTRRFVRLLLQPLLLVWALAVALSPER